MSPSHDQVSSVWASWYVLPSTFTQSAAQAMFGIMSMLLKATAVAPTVNFLRVACQRWLGSEGAACWARDRTVSPLCVDFVFADIDAPSYLPDKRFSSACQHSKEAAPDEHQTMLAARPAVDLRLWTNNQAMRERGRSA